jgi:hypothetical protein
MNLKTAKNQKTIKTQCGDHLLLLNRVEFGRVTIRYENERFEAWRITYSLNGAFKNSQTIPHILVHQTSFPSLNRFIMTVVITSL